MSWREFRFNLRPITLLAVGGVLFTTIAVAAAAHLVMELAWPIGFLLGAIVSPPDAISTALHCSPNGDPPTNNCYPQVKDWRTMRPR